MEEMIKGLSNEFNLTRLAGHIIGDNTDKSPIEIGNLIVKGFHSQGVFIRVKCPKCRGYARPNKVTYNLHEGYTVNGHSCPNCNNTGYVALEPLIEGKP